jgi:hypothetical protein
MTSNEQMAGRHVNKRINARGDRSSDDGAATLAHSGQMRRCRHNLQHSRQPGRLASCICCRAYMGCVGRVCSLASQTGVGRCPLPRTAGNHQVRIRGSCHTIEAARQQAVEAEPGANPSCICSLLPWHQPHHASPALRPPAEEA